MPRISPDDLIGILGLSSQRIKGKNVLDAATQSGKEVPVLINPTKKQIEQLSEMSKDENGQAWLRYIRDNDGNVYVAPGTDFTHYDMGEVLKSAGKLGDDFKWNSTDGTYGNYQAGSLVRNAMNEYEDTENPTADWLFGAAR